MDSIQKLFDETLRTELGYPRLLARLIAKKLKASGVKISSAQIDTVAEKIAGLSDGDRLRFKFQQWKFWDRKHVAIEVTEEDLKRLEEDIDAGLTGLPDLIADLSEDIAALLIPRMKEDWIANRRPSREAGEEFREEIKKIWGIALDDLGLSIAIADEIGQSISDTLQASSKPDDPNLANALLHLYARGCQVAREVHTLLWAGFADGGMGRWRTLHEIVVVAGLIREGGEELAERYLVHEVVDAWNSAQRYRELSVERGDDPIPEEELWNLENLYTAAVARFGAEFKSEYGWASRLLSLTRSRRQFAYAA